MCTRGWGRTVLLHVCTDSYSCCCWSWEAKKQPDRQKPQMSWKFLYAATSLCLGWILCFSLVTTPWSHSGESQEMEISSGTRTVDRLLAVVTCLSCVSGLKRDQNWRNLNKYYVSTFTPMTFCSLDSETQVQCIKHIINLKIDSKFIKVGPPGVEIWPFRFELPFWILEMSGMDSASSITPPNHSNIVQIGQAIRAN